MLKGYTLALHDILLSVSDFCSGIIKSIIEKYITTMTSSSFQKTKNGNVKPIKFETFDSFAPIVHVKGCFDDLRVPADHVSR